MDMKLGLMVFFSFQHLKDAFAQSCTARWSPLLLINHSARTQSAVSKYVTGLCALDAFKIFYLWCSQHDHDVLGALVSVWPRWGKCKIIPVNWYFSSNLGHFQP